MSTTIALNNSHTTTFAARVKAPSMAAQTASSVQPVAVGQTPKLTFVAVLLRAFSAGAA